MCANIYIYIYITNPINKLNINKSNRSTSENKKLEIKTNSTLKPINS